MNLANKTRYLRLIDNKINNEEVRLKGLEKAHNSAESAMTSRFDTQREDLEREMGAQKEILKNLKMFKLFIRVCGEKFVVAHGAELSIEFTDSGNLLENVLFAPFSVGLSSLQIVTQKSPLGAAILGKKTNEQFSYQMDGNEIRGVIRKVE